MASSSAKLSLWVFAIVGVALVFVLFFLPRGPGYQASGRVLFQPGTLSSRSGTWFDPATGSALAAELAAAVEGSDLCLGWEVDEHGVHDVGSNLGVGASATTCARWVVVAADLVYVPESSESNDTAGVALLSNDPAIQQTLDGDPLLVADAGYRALLGDDGDSAIANTLSAVVLKLGTTGDLEPLAVTPAEGGVPLEDAEGEDRSDAVHQGWGELKMGIGLLVLAAVGGLLLFLNRGGSGKARLGPGAAGSGAPGRPANPRHAMRAQVAAHRQAVAQAQAQGRGLPPAPGPQQPVTPPPPHHQEPPT